MTSPRTLIFILLLMGTFWAFDVSSYLYPTELNVTISYTNFTLNGTDYSIVKISGTDTFLLADGNPLSSQSGIDSAVYNYYRNNYYPSANEISNLRALLDSYNASRNDGQKFPGKEEYACRGVLFIDGRVKAGTEPIYCRNEDDEQFCEYSAMLLYQYLSALTTPPVGSASDLLQPIEDFGFSSYGTEEILKNADSRLDAAETDATKMYDALKYISDSVPDLDSYRTKIEDSKFGWTSDKTCDSNHWCLCPDMVLNSTALDQIETAADTLKTKVEPFKNYRNISTRLYANTLARFAYAENESTAAEYLESFGELNATGAAAIAVGEEAISHVSNSTLSTNFDRLVNLHSLIPEKIEERDFAGLDNDISDYTNLITLVNESAIAILDEYNQTLEAKNTATSLLLALEIKNLDPAAMASLEVLKNQTTDLDNSFSDSLTLSQLAEFKEEYASVTTRAQELLKTESNLPATKVLSLFRSFARRVNVGIASFAVTTQFMEPLAIPENPVINFGAFSMLLFLSLGSMMLLLFLYFLVFAKFTLPKSREVALSTFVCSILLIMSFSILMYIFLERTANNANLTEFLADSEQCASTAILVDLRNVSYADAQSMTSCASSLAYAFDQKNKTWAVYTLTPNTCTRSTSAGEESSMNVSACLAAADGQDSSFVLSYSQTPPPPAFSIVYKNSAHIAGSSSYYQSCPLVALFGS